jgi:hypothetical protein
MNLTSAILTVKQITLKVIRIFVAFIIIIMRCVDGTHIY